MSIIEAMPGFTFGCDPELFVLNTEGEYVTAEGLIPGTKSEPYPVPGGAIQVDGMAAEFNIDPVDNFTDFNKNITKVVQELKKMLPKGYDLSPIPSVVFNEKAWNEAPDKAKTLGCTPDFNAWTGKVNPPPHDPDNPYLRTASGHLHIGWTDDANLSDPQHVANCRDLIKQLDWYLGGWSLQMDPDPVRRRMYGKAGAMRFKPYGVEYRVLSNFWLTNSSRRMAVWNRMQQAIWDMREVYIPDEADKFKFNDALIQSIDTSTRNPALENEFKFPLQTLSSKSKLF